MKKISDIYGIVKESRERIIKTMQERGITELATILPYSEWCKKEECEPEEAEEDDDAYTEYKDQESPYVVFIGKYDMDDYRIDKVTLVGDRFKFEGISNELGYDWAWEDDTVWATRMFVWEKLEELLGIGDEPEKVWVLFDESLCDYELQGRRIMVFKSEDEARKKFKEFADKSRKTAEDNGWEIGNDDVDFFEAYPEGSWGTSHETVELSETTFSESIWCHA